MDEKKKNKNAYAKKECEGTGKEREGITELK